jgi:hypothetical protein
VVSGAQQPDFNGAVKQLIASVLFAVAQIEHETRRERRPLVSPPRKSVACTLVARLAQPRAGRKLREQGLTVDEVAAAMQVSRRNVFNYLSA